ncbi:hypothetical protein KUCAC02_034154, partial [Chaenocephalus aceratus]
LVSGFQAPLGNLPPSRGLERALEEAAARGALILSARKLKEFPRAANNHDLADTVDAGRIRGVGRVWDSNSQPWCWQLMWDVVMLSSD